MPRGTSLGSLAKRERPADGLPTARRLLGYLRPYRAQVAEATLWIMVSAANLSAAPAITGWVVDTALDARRAGAGAAPLALPVAALFLSAAAGWFSQRQQILALGTAGQRALFDVREDVFRSVQRLSLGSLERSTSGELMSRLINDVETVNSFLSQGLRRVLASGLGALATLAGMVLVEWRLALATLAVVPVMLGVTRVFGAVARRAFQRRQETLGEVSSTLAEELAGVRVAQAYARTERNRAEFGERNALNRDASIAAATVSSAFSPALAVVTAIATALVAWYGGTLAAAGTVSVGVVVAFFAYARSFFNGVTQLASLYGDMQSALAGGERIFGLIDEPNEIAESPDAVDPGRSAGAIRFERVRFRYGDGPLVLHDIDLTIEAGETVAIVGPTGAGKSTLVNLLARFYDPTDGRITLDGLDLRDLTLEGLRRNLGAVLQDPFLFAGTVAENIRYGRLDATDAEIVLAAQAARADEFITRLSAGYDTPVGERGASLSAGQRQLVAIARAILTDPAVLILDEATASVDTRTEILIQRGLRELMADRTALVIAHRLSTVRRADRIVVLERGRVTETGTYDGLLEREGLFARLHAAQFGNA